MSNIEDINIDIDGKSTFKVPIQIIDNFFPKIKNIDALKFFIYTIYRFQADNQRIQFVTKSQICQSKNIKELFEEGMNLNLILDELVEVNALLSIEGNFKNKKDSYYFLNNARSRAAIRAIQEGDWKPKSNIEFNPIVERPSIYQLFEDNLGGLTPFVVEMLDDAEKEYSYEWIEEAIKLSIKNDARNWSYVEAILKRWKKDKTNPWKGVNDDGEKEEDPFAHIYKK